MTLLLRFISFLLISLLSFGNYLFIYQTFALEKKELSIIEYLSKQSPKKNLSAEKLFIIMVDIFAEEKKIPKTYKFISLRAPLKKNTPLYKAYQKAVYMDLLPNDGKLLDLSGVATHQKMVEFTEKMFGETIDGEVLVNGNKLEVSPKRVIRYEDLVGYAEIILDTSSDFGFTFPTYEIEGAANFSILNDVFGKLKREHIDHENFSDDDLIAGAINGMTEATKDPYTIYFPPSDAREFNEDLNGTFEGIGAFVDMEKPGELRIVSPLSGSPAEKAGLKGGDMVISINQEPITEKTSLKEAVGRIKGPAGTSVIIEIRRGTETLTFTITRQKITIDLVVSKPLENGKYFIQVTSFGEGSASAFKTAIQTFNKSGSKKLILDLRNNPGGLVGEVGDMLGHFIPKGDPTFVMVEGGQDYTFPSNGEDMIANDVTIAILINEGSASASEIMASSLQDYLADRVKTYGQKSYGKGSAQTMIPYENGAAFKYTTAKWYTGKNRKSIDKVGIIPDVIIHSEKTDIMNGIDRVLDQVKNTNF